ncbi:MAG: ribonuclease E/G [Caulobacteraceae bacterium]
MADRRIYIDKAPGETRGVVTLDGRPERLLIEREGENWPRLGLRRRARVALVDRALGLAVLDLGEGQQASLRLKADRSPPVQGQSLDIEIAIEPQGGKPAVARVHAAEAGLDAPPPSLDQRLAALAPGAPTIMGVEARAIADEAEEEALAVEHALGGGVSLAIEPTRALTAVDIDLSAGGGDGKRAARQANLSALTALGRLLRLKALGGLVVVDLVGRGHDGPALAHAVQAAFAVDQPGVVIGPVTKFGTLELALPRRQRPVREILCDSVGQASARTLALRFVRAIERQALADPGARIVARCAPEIAAMAAGPAEALKGIVGARFEVVPDPALGRDQWDIAAP